MLGKQIILRSSAATNKGDQPPVLFCPDGTRYLVVLPAGRPSFCTRSPAVRNTTHFGDSVA